MQTDEPQLSAMEIKQMAARAISLRIDELRRLAFELAALKGVTLFDVTDEQATAQLFRKAQAEGVEPLAFFEQAKKRMANEIAGRKYVAARNKKGGSK